MPTLLEELLYSSIKSKCKNQESCMMRLHEITPFEWDKAYFFESKSSYYINIDKIIGDQPKVKQDVLTILVVFTKEDKIVNEDIFEVICSDYYHIGLLLFFQFSPRKTVDINFFLSKEKLKKYNY